MPDNKQIKDALGDLFTLRMRDVSLNQDGSVQRNLTLETLYPIDYGYGGVFQHCAKSGVINAGIAANSPIYSFQWPSITPEVPFALVRRVRLNAWTVAAFASGNVTFDIFVARAFTVADTGGTVASLNLSNMLRTSMASSLASIMCANTGALTPGTRVLDPAPLDSQTVIAPTTIGVPFTAQRMTLFEKLQGEHPLLLAPNEGFVVRVTVPPPGVGTWSFAITTEWDEVTIF